MGFWVRHDVIDEFFELKLFWLPMLRFEVEHVLSRVCLSNDVELVFLFRGVYTCRVEGFVRLARVGLSDHLEFT